MMPGQPEKLASMLDNVHLALADSYAPSTNRTDKYHLQAWQRACVKMGTPMWRTDMAANLGVDPNGYRRELMVIACGILLMYVEMQPRSRKDKAANPRSVLAKLYGVARKHKKRGLITASFALPAPQAEDFGHRHDLGGARARPDGQDPQRRSAVRPYGPHIRRRE